MKVLVATVVSIAVATSVSARHDSVRPLAVSAEARAAMTRYGLEAYENGDAKHPVHALLYTPKAWLLAALLLLAIPIVCVFYTAPSVKWMLDNTIPRLVWYLLAVPLAATLRGPRSAVRRSGGIPSPSLKRTDIPRRRAVPPRLMGLTTLFLSARS